MPYHEILNPRVLRTTLAGFPVKKQQQKIREEGNPGHFLKVFVNVVQSDLGPRTWT